MAADAAYYAVWWACPALFLPRLPGRRRRMKNMMIK
jgi:hypothetical protein